MAATLCMPHELEAALKHELARLHNAVRASGLTPILTPTLRWVPPKCGCPGWWHIRQSIRESFPADEDGNEGDAAISATADSLGQVFALAHRRLAEVMREMGEAA